MINEYLSTLLGNNWQDSWIKNKLKLLILIFFLLPFLILGFFYWYIWKKTQLDKTKKIIASIILTLILFALGSVNTQPVTNDRNEKSSVVEVEDTATTTSETPENDNQDNEPKALTHEELLNVSKEDAEQIVGSTYTMNLYLEQTPTDREAYFMSTIDENIQENILFLCSMSSEDIKQLDGESAQNRLYKIYNLEVDFKEFSSEYLTYTADCSLTDDITNKPFYNLLEIESEDIRDEVNAVVIEGYKKTESEYTKDQAKKFIEYYLERYADYKHITFHIYTSKNEMDISNEYAQSGGKTQEPLPLLIKGSQENSYKSFYYLDQRLEIN